MLNRRHLLAGAATVAASASAAPLAFARAIPPAPSDPTEAAKLNALMDDFMQRSLRETPEAATSLGLDTGDLAWTKSMLSDESRTTLLANRILNADELKRLREVKRAALSGMDGVNYDTVVFTFEVSDEINRKFDYGLPGGGGPYVLSQLTGAYQSVPDFMDNQHAIATKADADAYLARIEGFARQMDQEAEIGRHDADLGVIPPDFVLDKATGQMQSFLGQPTAQTTLVASIARRAKDKGIAGDWAGSASKLYDEKVRPALERQLALLESWRPNAVHDAGVWRLPDGVDYYALGVKQYTTSSMTPDEIFKTGTDLVASLSAQADVIMRKQGLTRGCLLYTSPS